MLLTAFLKFFIFNITIIWCYLFKLFICIRVSIFMKIFIIAYIILHFRIALVQKNWTVCLCYILMFLTYSHESQVFLWILVWVLVIIQILYFWFVLLDKVKWSFIILIQVWGLIKLQLFIWMINIWIDKLSIILLRISWNWEFKMEGRMIGVLNINS